MFFTSTMANVGISIRIFYFLAFCSRNAADESSLVLWLILPILYLRPMEQLAAQIENYKKEVLAFTPQNAEEVEQFRIKYLGSKGLVKNLMAEMKNVPPEQKREAGQLRNEFKTLVENHFESFSSLQQNNHHSTQQININLPGNDIAIGSLHPLSIVRNKIIQIFERLGFAVAEGPEIEDDWHNFGAMNLPEDHPARDMQDTFYINQNPAWVLRTHTSSLQARVMEQQKPPIRVICPGRVYRNETISARGCTLLFSLGGRIVS
jgi:phenylalanyl-tRNA synthetase alpha chain